MHDSFRPKFPLDPFAGHAQPEPWLVDPDFVRSLTESSPRTNVFLILGEPSQHDIEPLLHSQLLVNSLLLLITHSPPQIPPSVVPSVRILRTLRPLFSDESGAVGFASALERAERLARLWRTTRGSQRCLQFCEDAPGGDFTVPESMGYLPISSSSLQASRPRPVRPVSTVSLSATKSTSSLRLERFHETAPARSFDAILNFLPASLPDKLMFKQAVLLTTLSQTFLTTTSYLPTTQSGPPSPNARRRRSSILSWFQSSDSLDDQLSSTPGTPRSQSPITAKGASYLTLESTFPSRAHLVHVLPIPQFTKAKPALVHSLEQFLLSFHFRAPLKSSLHSKHPTSGPLPPTSVHSSPTLPRLRPAKPKINDGPVPYILPASLLGHVPTNSTSTREGELTLLELVLLGALDTPQSEDHSLFGGLSYPVRTWVAGPHDVRISGAEVEGNLPRRPPKAFATEAHRSSVADTRLVASTPVLNRLVTSKTTNSASSSSESSTENSSNPMSVIALSEHGTAFDPQLEATSPPRNSHHRRPSTLRKDPHTKGVCADQSVSRSGKWRFWKKMK